MIFGLLAGGELYGIAGVLVALPTMAGLRAIWGFFRERFELESWDEECSEVPVEVELEPPRAASSADSVCRVWETIPRRRGRERALGRGALVPDGDREREPVFSPLAPEELRLGLETIYEGYLVHYGRSRLFAPADGDTALLLGDYLYAHGLVRVAETGNVAAVADLAELISLCATGTRRRPVRRRRGVGRNGVAARGGGSARPAMLSGWRRARGARRCGPRCSG